MGNQSINIIFQMLGRNNIIQKSVGEGKARKSKKKNDEKEVVHNKKDHSPSLKIKFNISKDNIACFINSKNTHKKHNKSQLSPKKNPKSQSKLEKKPSDKNIGNQKKPWPKNNQCKDIIESSLKAIFNETQPEDAKCQWSVPDEPTPQSSDQLYPSISSQIWSNEKSYASTIDMHPVQSVHPTLSYYMSGYMNNYTEYSYKQPQETYIVDGDNILNDLRTTIMIRNIPNKYTIKDLSDEIDQILPNTYDFLYLPCDIKNQCNVGYGFINFVNTHFLYEFYQEFHGQKWLKFRSEKICNLTYARLQGLNSLIEHFQNSKVLNQKEKKYRPIIRQYGKIGSLIKNQQLL